MPNLHQGFKFLNFNVVEHTYRYRNTANILIHDMNSNYHKPKVVDFQSYLSKRILMTKSDWM